MAAAVEVLAASDETLVTGRGLAFGTALEVALKLEETCLRPVRGLSYADLRHGPIAVVGPGLTARGRRRPRRTDARPAGRARPRPDRRGALGSLAVGGDAAAGRRRRRTTCRVRTSPSRSPRSA